MTGNLTPEETGLIEYINGMIREANIAVTNGTPYMRCIEGEIAVYAPAERALIPGHIATEPGLREMRISSCCEFHFDKMFQSGWTDPVTGDPGDTPEEEDGPWPSN